MIGSRSFQMTGAKKSSYWLSRPTVGSKVSTSQPFRRDCHIFGLSQRSCCWTCLFRRTVTSAYPTFTFALASPSQGGEYNMAQSFFHHARANWPSSQQVTGKSVLIGQAHRDPMSLLLSRSIRFAKTSLCGRLAKVFREKSGFKFCEMSSSSMASSSRPMYKSRPETWLMSCASCVHCQFSTIRNRLT